MEIDSRNLVESLFRFTHVVSGILWVGLLFFFNWVNAPFAASLDAETRRRVVPGLMPRALWFFRWASLWTLVTGMALSSFVYYETKLFFERPDAQTWNGRAVTIVLVTFLGFAVYEPLMKAVRNPRAQGAIGFVLVTLFFFAARRWAGFGFRGAFIHVGMLLGVIMAANVWMRIWPNLRRAIASTRAGEAPDPAWGAAASERSRHNAYMAVPLVFAMLSQHATWAASGDWSMPAVLALSWVAVALLYRKAGALTV